MCLEIYTSFFFLLSASLVNEPMIGEFHSNSEVPLTRRIKRDALEIQVPNPWVHAKEGTNVNISCIIRGEPVPSMMWKKADGQVIHNNEHYHLETLGHLHTLQIRDLKEEDFGRYECAASNSLSSASENVHITGVPQVPVITSKPDGSRGTKYTISWTVDSITPVDEYSVIYRKKFGNGEWETKIVPATDESENGMYTQMFRLEDLEPGTLYEAVVRARNKFGWSKESEVLVFSTKNDGVPQVPVITSKPDGSQGTKYTISWTVDSITPVEDYSVMYRKKFGNGEWETKIVPATDKSENGMYTQKFQLEDLEPGTLYEAFVTARNTFGWSKESEVLVFSTKTDGISSVPYFTRPDRMRDQVSTPAGSTVSLKCPVDGNPTPKINWLKDGVPVEKGNYVRVQKWTLRLEHVTTADQGVYTCIASNAEGSISFDFRVEVTEMLPYRPIMLENYPSNLTVAVGETAVLECRFLSDLQPALKWAKFTEQNGSSSDRFNGPHMKIVESTSTTNTDPKFLILENVTLEDAGEYVCIVSNTVGVSKQSAWLTVIPGILRAPYFTKPDRMNEIVAVPAGGFASLRCPAGGNPTPKIIWLKDGILVEKRSNVRVQKYTLRLEHLTAADQGVYTCIASNAEGSISFDFRVEVVDKLPHRPIMLENYPSNVTVTVGETAVFECRFISDLHPALMWAKFTEVNGSSSDRFNGPHMKIVESTSTTNTDPKLLILENVTMEDAGEYVCIVSNVFGQSKQSAWLTVVPDGFQPSEMEYFYVLPSNTTIHVGEVATFECKFNGSPNTVEWVKYYEMDGSSLNELGVPYMKRVQDRSINHIKANQLTLQNVTFDDAGKYACVVSYDFGNCQQYTWLTVLPK